MLAENQELPFTDEEMIANFVFAGLPVMEEVHPSK